MHAQIEPRTRRHKAGSKTRFAGVTATATQKRLAQAVMLKFQRTLAKLPHEGRRADIALYDEFGLPL
ncbi:MAG: hypothetical protein V4650_03485 [Pseudomonadota bacterium]